MKILSKALAAVLCATLSFTLFSCGTESKNSLEKTVSEDSPWFNFEEVDFNINDELDSSTDYELWDIDSKGHFLCFSSGIRENSIRRDSTSAELKEMDFNSIFYEKLFYADEKGTVLCQTEIGKLKRDAEVATFGRSDNGYRFLIVGDYYYELDLDTTRNAFSDLKKVEFEHDNKYNSEEYDFIMLSDGRIATVNQFNSGNYVLIVRDKDYKIIGSLDISDFIENMIYAYHYELDSDGNIMFIGPKIFSVDPDSMTAELITDRPGKYRNMEFTGDSFCYIDQDGIKRVVYDREKKSFDESLLVSYNECNVDRYRLLSKDLYSFGFINADENEIIFSMSESLDNSNGHSLCQMVVGRLKRADKNPNTGKKLITVGVFDSGMDRYLLDLIRRFNEDSGDAMAIIKNYDIERGLSTDVQDPNDEVYTKAQNEMANSVILDILSGDGPDIIWNAGRFSQLDTPGTLVALDEYLDEAHGFNESDYFMSIFDVSRTDGKLYQIPLTFQLVGLRSTVKPQNGRGFTLDEYRDFVKESCGNKDPLGRFRTRIKYFQDNLSLFTGSGEYYFDNPVFRAYCEYCKESIPDKPDGFISYGDASTIDPVDGRIQHTYLESLFYECFMTTGNHKVIASGPATYARAVHSGNKDYCFCGFSSDGSGPAASIYDSIGISAASPYVDECWEFILKALSYDEEILNIDIFTVRRDVFEESDRKNVDWEKELELHEHPSNWNYYNEETGEEILDVIDNVRHSLRTDSGVSMIVMEEIPAYFEDQKSLDDVISIIDNRVKTLLDERR